MASRVKNVMVCHKDATGEGYLERMVTLTMSVTIDAGGLPVVVKGYGINEARFSTLQEVYDTFCCFMAPITLDYGGCEEIAVCLEELGFERPRGYFT